MTLNDTFIPSCRQNILIIGSTGRLGQEILRQLIAHPSVPRVHAFCRNPSKLSPDFVKVCASIQVGDAFESQALASALHKTQADTVIVSIGNGDSVKQTQTRTACAQALADALLETTTTATTKATGRPVQVVVVSSVGAGSSRIRVGMGMGKLIQHHLRHVLKDHTEQEQVFLEDQELSKRTWIVRATALTDDDDDSKEEHHKNRSDRVVEFGDQQTCPTSHIHRGAVATYIVNGICNDRPQQRGQTVNITAAKRSRRH